MSQILNKISELAKQIRKQETDKEDLEDMEAFLMERISKFPKYFSSVINMECRMTIMRQLYDREDYQDKYINMDRARRSLHIGAADAINQINRLCKRYNMEPIFKFPSIGDRDLRPKAEIEGNAIMEREAKDDRELAADAIYGFCKEVFLDAQSKERYNQIENYTREQRDQELFEIGKTNGYFKESLSLDELIAQAKNESDPALATDSKSLEFETDICL